MALAEWPPTDSEPRCFADNVHDTIYVYNPLCVLIDRPEFQRLRSIRQLSAVHLVFPSGDHSRFVHCLGTYHLATKFVAKLRAKFPELRITPAEHLCVSIAALLHDIGHGPFSHLFDGIFRIAVGGKWSHEEMSCRLVDSILHECQVSEALKPYLGEGQCYEDNVLFIKELIHSNKFPVPLDEVKGWSMSKEERKEWAAVNWQLRGRDISRSFLFDIVSNEFDSHDVDKYDYMLRDAKCTKAAIALRTCNIDRIMENCKVLLDPDFSFRRISYAIKVARNDIASVGEARQRLHDTVYQHLTVKIIEEMLVEILLKADEHLKFRGNDGQLYRLSEIHKDIGAYIKADDTILNEINRSESEELAEARNIYKKIQRREFPRKLVQCNYSKSTLLAASQDIRDVNSVHEIIKAELKKELPPELENHTFLIKRQLSKGSESSVLPLRKVLVYDNRDIRHGISVSEGTYLTQEDISTRTTVDASVFGLALFVSRHLAQEQRRTIRDIFNNILARNALTTDYSDEE